MTTHRLVATAVAFILAVAVGGIPGEHQVAGISSDPDDDKYVAAAVEGRAAFVVSGDPDLLEIGEHQGVRYRVPGSFGRV